MANTKKTEKTFDPQAAHEELVSLLTEIKEAIEETNEKLQNLDLPGYDFSVFSSD